MVLTVLPADLHHEETDSESDTLIMRTSQYRTSEAAIRHSIEHSGNWLSLQHEHSLICSRSIVVQGQVDSLLKFLSFTAQPLIIIPKMFGVNNLL